MRSNFDLQTLTYGGQLNFPATSSYATPISIPLYLKQADIPIRKPKLTEINTIPTHDESGVSDWSTHLLIMGGQGVLQTSISGHFITPQISITDNRGQVYKQLNPTSDQVFLGYSYGDLVWAYIGGKMNQPTSHIFLRTDPSSYIDSYGNQYNTVVIQQFQCDYTVWEAMQSFSTTLYLEV